MIKCSFKLRLKFLTHGICISTGCSLAEWCFEDRFLSPRMSFISLTKLKHFTLKITLVQVWEVCTPNPQAAGEGSALHFFGAHVSEAGWPRGSDSTKIMLLKGLPALLLTVQLTYQTCKHGEGRTTNPCFFGGANLKENLHFEFKHCIIILIQIPSCWKIINGFYVGNHELINSADLLVQQWCCWGLVTCNETVVSQELRLPALV